LCSAVRGQPFEIDALHREIAETVRDLLALGLSSKPDLWFVFSSERIGQTLLALHMHAVAIAEECLRLSDMGGKLECPEIIALGEVVNNLVTLCVEAMFEGEMLHADAVLCNRQVERLFERTFCGWFRTLDLAARQQAECERAVARRFSCMARQTYEIADAIALWLRDGKVELELRAQRQQRRHFPKGPKITSGSLFSQTAFRATWIR
jgi:hypothetical protein